MVPGSQITPACIKTQQTVPWGPNSLIANTYTQAYTHAISSKNKTQSNASLATIDITRASMFCLHPQHPRDPKKHYDHNAPCPTHSARTHCPLKTTRNTRYSSRRISHPVTTSIEDSLDPKNLCMHPQPHPHTQNRNAECPNGRGQAPPVLDRKRLRHTLPHNDPLKSTQQCHFWGIPHPSSIRLSRGCSYRDMGTPSISFRGQQHL